MQSFTQSLVTHTTFSRTQSFTHTHTHLCKAWPRKWNVDVAKCHCCHAKWRRQIQPSATSATPAMRKARLAPNSHQAPQQIQPSESMPHLLHLPHKRSGAASWATNRDQAPPTQLPTCHSCHAKGRSMSPSARLAMQVVCVCVKDCP